MSCARIWACVFSGRLIGCHVCGVRSVLRIVGF